MKTGDAYHNVDASAAAAAEDEAAAAAAAAAASVLEDGAEGPEFSFLRYLAVTLLLFLAPVYSSNPPLSLYIAVISSRPVAVTLRAMRCPLPS